MRLALLSLLAILEPSLSYVVPPKTHVGVTIPLVKRTNLRDERGVVYAQALNSELPKMERKMQRGFGAFKKNTGVSHPSDIKRLFRRSPGALPLTDDNGSLWQGFIEVGTPPVPFIVDFDTGSSDLFLPATDCQINCRGHRRYNANSSTTAQDLGRNFSLAFGDGSTVRGEQFVDTVIIAGLNATNQTVGAAIEYSTGFSASQFSPDGLLGMAFPQISAFNTTPVFHTLVTQNQTTIPEFGFKLTPEDSELFVGGTNPNLFNGSFVQNPITQLGFWQIALDSVDVNGNTTSTNLSAIIDTGTTLVLGDTDSVVSLYSTIPGAQDASNIVGPGFFTVPCDTIPNITLTFGGKAFPISAESFNLGLVSQGSTDCVGGIAAADLGNFWVVGDVFLQNVYTSFNVGNSTVGFADLS